MKFRHLVFIVREPRLWWSVRRRLRLARRGIYSIEA